MDCAEVHDLLRGGRPPTGAEVERHLAECDACRELAQDEASLGRALLHSERTPVPDPPAWSDLERALSAEKGARAWLRSRSTPVRWLVAAVAAAAVIALGWVSGFGVSSSALAAFWLVAFVAAAALGLRFALPALERPLPERRTELSLLLAALALPLGYAALAQSLFGEPSAGDAALPAAAGCFVFGTLLSVPFLFALWSVERSELGWSRLLLRAGAVAGLVVNAALLVHCPNTAPLHLVLGHAAIGGALVAVGALAAGRAERA